MSRVEVTQTSDRAPIAIVFLSMLARGSFSPAELPACCKADIELLRALLASHVPTKEKELCVASACTELQGSGSA